MLCACPTGWRWGWASHLLISSCRANEPALWLGPAAGGAACTCPLPSWRRSGTLRPRASALGAVAAAVGLGHRSPGAPRAWRRRTHQPAAVQHQCRGPHRRYPAPAGKRAGRARGGAPERQQRAADRDDVRQQRAHLALQGRARRFMSATGCWCSPTSRRRPEPAATRRPSISSGLPGTSSSAPWAMRWAPATVIEHGRP